MSVRPPKFITDDNAREVFVRLVTRGFTVRGLRKRMSQEGVPISADVSDTIIINYMRSVREDLETTRSEADQDFPFFYGMVSAFERARRLIELAEDIEPRARTDTDWAGQYRQVLAQIRTELEPFKITIEPGDQWADLLERLIDAAPKMDESDVEPEVAGREPAAHEFGSMAQS